MCLAAAFHGLEGVHVEDAAVCAEEGVEAEAEVVFADFVVEVGDVEGLGGGVGGFCGGHCFFVGGIGGWGGGGLGWVVVGGWGVTRRGEARAGGFFYDGVHKAIVKTKV